MSSTDTRALIHHEYAPKTLADKITLTRLRTVNQRRAVQDKSARSHLAAALNTEEDAYNVSKKLFSKSKRYAAVKTALNAASAYWRENTLPWLDKGFRGLPNVKYMEFTQGFAPLKANVDICVAEFVTHWDAEVNHDLWYLRSRGNPADYPTTPPEISVELTFMPCPDKGDFRVEQSPADIARFDAAIAKAEELQRADLLNRMVSGIQAMSERLAEFKGEKGQRWHQSTVDSLFDSLRTVEELNIHGDANVATLVGDIRQALSPFKGNDSLKHSQHSRDAAKQQIDDILSKFA